MHGGRKGRPLLLGAIASVSPGEDDKSWEALSLPTTTKVVPETETLRKKKDATMPGVGVGEVGENEKLFFYVFY